MTRIANDAVASENRVKEKQRGRIHNKTRVRAEVAERAHALENKLQQGAKKGTNRGQRSLNFGGSTDYTLIR